MMEAMLVAPRWCFLQQPLLGIFSDGAEAPECRATEAVAEWSWIIFRILMCLTTCVHLAIQRYRGWDNINVASSERHGGGTWGKRMRLLVAWTPTIMAVLSGSSGLSWARPVQCAALQFIGAAGSVFCIGLFVWIHISLGRNWSPVPEAKQNHELVVSGPYCFARHPMYAVLAMWLLPVTALATLNWALTLATSAAFIEFASRIPEEEALLVEQFGDEYEAYRSQVGALGPHLFVVVRNLRKKSVQPENCGCKHFKEPKLYCNVEASGSPLTATSIREFVSSP